MNRILKPIATGRRLAWILALVFLLPSHGARADSRGLGPFQLMTRDGEIPVRLLRRDANLVWLLRRTSSGKDLEVGVAPADVGRFVFGPQQAFEAARQAGTADEIANAQHALRTVSRRLKVYRDLPGMIVDEAILLEGLLYERMDKPSVALKLYDDILQQSYPSDQRSPARLRAGICRSKIGEFEQAIEDLDPSLVPADDLELATDVYHARGHALTRLERYDEAVLSFLRPVVFHPFVANAEPRCLEGVLACYAAMGDWSSFHRTYLVLRDDYPGAEQTARARQFAGEHEEALSRMGFVLEPTAPESMDENESVEGEINVL